MGNPSILRRFRPDSASCEAALRAILRKKEKAGVPSTGENSNPKKKGLAHDRATTSIPAN